MCVHFSWFLDSMYMGHYAVFSFSAWLLSLSIILSRCIADGKILVEAAGLVQCPQSCVLRGKRWWWECAHASYPHPCSRQVQSGNLTRGVRLWGAGDGARTELVTSRPVVLKCFWSLDSLANLLDILNPLNWNLQGWDLGFRNYFSSTFIEI